MKPRRIPIDGVPVENVQQLERHLLWAALRARPYSSISGGINAGDDR